MSGTNPPVPRPTAGSIYRSFLLSHKRHLLLTGGRGSGKSRLVDSLLPLLSPGPVPGIRTQVRRGYGVFLIGPDGGEPLRIGQFDPSLPGPENRMRPDGEAIAVQGIRALERCAQSGGEWCVLDEIGYLECGTEAYCQAILALMERRRLIAAVRKAELPFLRRLRERPDVYVCDLDAPFAETGCVIMAAGQGRRFGGNKLMADLGGAPLIAPVLTATENLFHSRIVVAGHPDTAKYCEARGVRTVLCGHPRRNDTVRIGLGEMPGEIRGCLFCHGDQPLLTRETTEAILLAHTHGCGWIWRLAYNGVPGAPVLFPRWTFPLLRQLPQGRGGNAVVQRCPDRTRLVPALHAGELMDVDTPEDLALVRRIWGQANEAAAPQTRPNALAE